VYIELEMDESDGWRMCIERRAEAVLEEDMCLEPEGRGGKSLPLLK
jgi:hypothetical protein